MKEDQRKELYLTLGKGMKSLLPRASPRHLCGSIRNKRGHCSVRTLGELTWDILLGYSLKFNKYNIYKTG